MSLTCRLCFNEIGKNLERHYVKINSVQMVLAECRKKIQDLLDIDVDDDEFMTDLICILCWNKLLAFSEFYTQIKDIQERYKEGRRQLYILGMKPAVRDMVQVKVLNDNKRKDFAAIPPYTKNDSLQSATPLDEESIKIELDEFDEPIIAQKSSKDLNGCNLFTALPKNYNNKREHSNVGETIIIEPDESDLKEPVKILNACSLFATSSSIPMVHSCTPKPVKILNGSKNSNTSENESNNSVKLKVSKLHRTKDLPLLSTEVGIVSDGTTNYSINKANNPNRPYRCIVENCDVIEGQGFYLYRYSRHYTYYDLWAKNCKIKESPSHSIFVCARHFKAEYIHNGTLLRNAVPTLFINL